ncbi:CSLREA domain-containing protein [Acinetobacter silvestris]|uniref:GlyGly-CTERM sorting domain-containing protein n=1 Tax=Acinetobacter silvestris TaxID=1977882 RepID=A0A1Y3CL81_9GAMM|nr:CSLREA domain-containing protein [Acinetobacter silvestris]OTG66620.1 GlyGly-CTERM sorting domain-containing protein [Acinetobacter silvestris]
MKHYKKGLLTLTILSAMSLMAADDKTIYVNTFVDEDGENASKCSLREAVTAASTHKAYGGCSAGQSNASEVSVIQLEAGEYKLNKELQPNSSMIIQGKIPTDYSRTDVLTNTYPALITVQTSISGQGKVRIINTTNLNKPSITLNHLILKDGFSSTLGGALYVGGATTLSNVSILNSKAQVGGAIYLNDINSHLTISKGNYQSNDAVQGSVLAMTCNDNLIYTARNIAITGASFLKNGSSNSASVFGFCGQPTVNFATNTIADNDANLDFGSIMQFSSKNPQGTAHLSASSSLVMLSNTIVKNRAWATLLYDSFGSKVLTNNILAYNGVGKSCRYADGDVTEVKTTDLRLNSNALILASGNDQCDLPAETVKDIKESTIDLSGVDFTTVLSTLQGPTEYTAFMYMYFPKDNATKTDLVDVGATGCSLQDQRGITRVSSTNSTNENESQNSCDIGATEVLRLTAGNIGALNQSKVKLLERYQTESSRFKALIDNPQTNPEFLSYYKVQLALYDTWKTIIKDEPHYRTVFIDPFVVNLPDENVLPDGGREIKHLNVDNYGVTVKVLGVGKLNSQNQFEGNVDDHLKCEWNPELKQIVMYRLDDRITPSGDTEFCSYTLTMKSNPAKSSTAYIMANFANIEPIAKDASYTIQHGGSQSVDVNLLEYANDDGDGSTTTLVNNPNKSKFYLNEKGEELAIRIGKLPDPVSITADRTGPCPGSDLKSTCYGGKLHIQIKNTLDPFNYKFTYFVYDANGLVSNEATVYLNNSEMKSDSVRKSGGGSMGWLSLFGIVGLFGYRKYQSRKCV